jgi:hypothetical protein
MGASVYRQFVTGLPPPLRRILIPPFVAGTVRQRKSTILAPGSRARDLLLCVANDLYCSAKTGEKK